MSCGLTTGDIHVTPHRQDRGEPHPRLAVGWHITQEAFDLACVAGDEVRREWIHHGPSHVPAHRQPSSTRHEGEPRWI